MYLNIPKINFYKGFTTIEDKYNVVKDYYDNYKKMKNIPKNVKLVPYLNDMLGVMKSTDLIISRAGASTISEITALGLPSILIPSPYVTHNHQEENAKVLENNGASIIIKEKEGDFSHENDTYVHSLT